jgi:hypothetical protein
VGGALKSIQGVLYRVPTGEPVDLPLHHLAAFGVTEYSGKTTLIEAAIMAAQYRGLTFRTKRGELGFEGATRLPIYFEDKGLTHWRNLEGLMSATFNERIEREPGIRYAVQQVCKQPAPAETLQQVFERAQEKQREFKAGTFKEEIFGKLVNYLEEILPQLRRIPYTDRLEMGESGLYMMDLVGLTDEMQNLVIANVLRKIYSDGSNVIVVLPEVSKFLPASQGSPVKWMFNRLISEGRSVGIYMWLDTQNLKGVDKTPLRSVAVRLFGMQPDAYEIKELLRALPGEPLPRPVDIMKLKVGHFFTNFRGRMLEVYVRPYWLPEEVAVRVARGELEPDSEEVQRWKEEAAGAKVYPVGTDTEEVFEDLEDWSEVERRVREVEAKLR